MLELTAVVNSALTADQRDVIIQQIQNRTLDFWDLEEASDAVKKDREIIIAAVVATCKRGLQG